MEAGVGGLGSSVGEGVDILEIKLSDEVGVL